MDAAFAQFGFDDMRRIIVHEEPINYRFAIGVLKHRFTENLRGMQGRRSRQGDFYRLEVFDNCPILTLEIPLVTIGDFLRLHHLVQRIASVCFIHDD